MQGSSRPTRNTAASGGQAVAPMAVDLPATIDNSSYKKEDLTPARLSTMADVQLALEAINRAERITKMWYYLRRVVRVYGVWIGMGLLR